MTIRGTWSKVRGSILVVALLAITSATAFAEAPKSCAQLREELGDTRADKAVNRLAGNKCLGDEFDTDPSTQQVDRLFTNTNFVEGQPRQKINEVVLSDEEAQALILAVLHIARDYLRRVSTDAGRADAAELSRIETHLAKAVRDRTDGVKAGTQSPAQLGSFWTWDGLQSTLGDTGVDIAGMLKRAGCLDTPRGPACAGTRQTVEGMLRAARLVERAFTPAQMKAIQAASARAAVRDARWRSYFSDTRSQYFWELILNSWRYEATVRKELGVSGPPTSQVILFHPDVGLQYISSAAPGDRLKPALIVELVGYNTWRWGSDNKPERALGASFVRTYADTSTISSGAWGVAVHWSNKYSLTLTQRSGKTGIAISVDLAGKAAQAPEDLRNQFRIGQ